MTLGDLKELIEDLERMQGDDVLNMDVYAEYNYGDHARTRALTIFEDVQVTIPYKTAYSDSGLAITEDTSRRTEGEKVVVLTRR